MKVYVDKMPENCLECKFYARTIFNEDGCMMNPCIFCGDGIPNDCELNLLLVHDKEVRKKERDKIIKELSDFEYEITNYGDFTRADLVRFVEYLKEKGDKE